MTGVVADTHTVIWFLANAPQLSVNARAALNGTVSSGGSIFVASITLVEMTYLVEKGRIAAAVIDALVLALDDPTSGFILAPLDRPIVTALASVPRNAVPDMPDRIIAATAFHLGLPLVSRDRKIQASTIQTIW